MNVRYFEKRPGAWHLDFKDASGRRVRPYGGPTEAAARKAAPGVIAEALAAGTTPAAAVAKGPAPASLPQGPTLRKAFELALKVRPQWIQAKARGSLETTYGAIVAGGGVSDDTPVASLTRDKVRDLRSRWLAEPGKRQGSTLSASTINHRLSMLSVLLEVADLPPHGVKHLSTKGNARHRRVSDAELARCLEWAHEATELGRSGAVEFARLIPLGLDTGARLSELLGLDWADVSESTVTFRDTKNGLTRTIPLRPAAQAALRAAAGLPRPFPTLTADRVTQLWALMRHSMGLQDDHRFVFHLLRHECASRFADEGKGAHFIKAWLGHENITTSESYVNVSVGGLAAQVGVVL